MNPRPFLMLTARDAPLDRIVALDESADDYLIKPFDYGELLARIRAVLQRPTDDRSPLLRCGTLTVEPTARQPLVGVASFELTPRKFAIVEPIRKSLAVEHSRTIALQTRRGKADAVGSNTIDVHVARFRAKLVGFDARSETLRCSGYRLATS